MVSPRMAPRSTSGPALAVCEARSTSSGSIHYLQLGYETWVSADSLTSVVGSHSLIVADAEGVEDGGDVDIPEHAAAAPAAATPASKGTLQLIPTLHLHYTSPSCSAAHGRCRRDVHGSPRAAALSRRVHLRVSRVCLATQ